MLARCTSSLDLHMLIVPYWYLFRTLLVPKVALGIGTVACFGDGLAARSARLGTLRATRLRPLRPSAGHSHRKGYSYISSTTFYDQGVYCALDCIVIMTRLNRLVSEAWMSECCSCGSHTGSLLSISGLFEIVFKVMIHFRALFCDYKMMYRVTNRCHVVCNATRP